MNNVDELIDSLTFFGSKIEELKTSLKDNDDERFESASSAYLSELERLSNLIEPLTIAYKEARKAEDN